MNSISPTRFSAMRTRPANISKACIGRTVRYARTVSCMNVTKVGGKSARPGVYKCNDCRKQFTVTVGTIFEDSKIPLNKWLLAFRLLSGGKKGISAHQLHRMLGVTYKTRVVHGAPHPRSHEGRRSGPLGGPGKIVEADETYVGGKAQEPRLPQARAQEEGCDPGRARRPRPLLPCCQCPRQHASRAPRHERRPRVARS